MLLLVLILVVIAFGLLVVALLTGSVLWAWVSVGVSVVAAVVLLIDWLQRRSAVKAGAAAPVSSPPARPTPMVDLDPATEILPVVPATGRRGSDPDEAPVDRTERVQDAQQTIVMPVVQPSSSSARPSSAEGTITSSGGVSSPSVTKAGAESIGSVESGDSADEVTRTTARPPAATSGETVSISRDSLPTESARTSAASDTQVSGAGEPDAEDADTTKVVAPRTSLSKSDGAAAVQKPAERSSTADVTEVVTLDGVSERDDSGSDATTTVVRGPASVEAGPSGSEQTVVTSLAAVTGSRPDPVDEAPKPPVEDTVSATPDAAAGRDHESTSDVEKTVKVEARTPKNLAGGDGASAVPPPPVQTPPPVPEASPVVSTPERAPVDEAPDAEPATVEQSSPAEKPAGRTPTRQDVDLFAPASEPAGSDLPLGPLSEAPEEQSDPIAAEIVSGLDDEVVVVDEQPRYHVPTCRALASTAVIPLPVREAVELGFTPCGWCSPERTLSGQHRTAAH